MALEGVFGSRVGKAVVELVGDSSKLRREFDMAKKDVGSASDEMTASQQKWKSAVVAGAAVAGAAVIAFAADAIRSYAEAEKVAAQTNAAIESTGGAANVTAAHVADLAANIQDYSGQSDEAVQSAANMLLTFTKVRNEVGKGNAVFDRGVHTIVDLSQAMHVDLNSAAKMVGKALNDPVKGVTALTRAGVQFTEQQKDQIKTLIESGRTLEAQKMILGELEVQVGGSAEAFGDTFAGKVAILSANFDDLKESVGGPLVNYLSDVVGNLNAIAEAIHDMPDLPEWMKPKGPPTVINPTDKRGLPALLGAKSVVDIMNEEKETAAGVAEAQEEVAGSTIDVADANVQLIASAGKLNEDLREQLGIQQQLAGGYLGIQGAALSLRDAQDDLREAQDKVNRLQQRGKEGSERYTDAVKERRDAELDAVQAVASLDAAVLKYKEQLEESGLSQDAVNEKIREYGRRAGLSRGEVQRLLDRVGGLNEEFGKLPKEPKDLRVKAPGLEDVQRRFSNLVNTIGQIPGEITTIVKGSLATGAVSHQQLASGGVVRAAAGVVTRPTLLVGEGARRTFAGPGAEGVIPFDQRGIGILAEALRQAGAGGGAEGGTVVNVRGSLVGGRPGMRELQKISDQERRTRRVMMGDF